MNTERHSLQCAVSVTSHLSLTRRSHRLSVYDELLPRVLKTARGKGPRQNQDQGCREGESWVGTLCLDKRQKVGLARQQRAGLPPAPRLPRATFSPALGQRPHARAHTHTHTRLPGCGTSAQAWSHACELHRRDTTVLACDRGQSNTALNPSALRLTARSCRKSRDGSQCFKGTN